MDKNSKTCSASKHHSSQQTEANAIGTNSQKCYGGLCTTARIIEHYKVHKSQARKGRELTCHGGRRGAMWQWVSKHAPGLVCLFTTRDLHLGLLRLHRRTYCNILTASHGALHCKAFTDILLLTCHDKCLSDVYVPAVQACGQIPGQLDKSLLLNC